MNDLINRKKAERFVLLREIYNATEAQPTKVIQAETLVKNTKLNMDEFKAAYYYLGQGEFTRYMGAGYRICITHKGITEVEKTLTNKSEASEFFPPYDLIDGIMDSTIITS